MNPHDLSRITTVALLCVLAAGACDEAGPTTPADPTPVVVQCDSQACLPTQPALGVDFTDNRWQICCGSAPAFIEKLKEVRAKHCAGTGQATANGTYEKGTTVSAYTDTADGARGARLNASGGNDAFFECGANLDSLIEQSDSIFATCCLE